MKLQILILLVLLGCNNNVDSPVEHEEWKIKRKSALYADDGYLNLAGLYPIEEGNYTIGSGNHNESAIEIVCEKELSKSFKFFPAKSKKL